LRLRGRQPLVKVPMALQQKEAWERLRGQLRLRGRQRLVRMHGWLRVVRMHGWLRVVKVHDWLRVRVHGWLRLVRMHGWVRLVRVDSPMALQQKERPGWEPPALPVQEPSR